MNCAGRPSSTLSGAASARLTSTSSRNSLHLPPAKTAPSPESENLRIRTRQTSGSRNGHSPKAKAEKRRIPKKRIEKDAGEKDTDEDTPTQNGRAPRGVGVGSKFSLEECVRYAE